MEERFDLLIRPVLEILGMSLTNDRIQALARHYELLVRWNQRVNLTSIRNPQRLVERHFGESLFVSRAIPPTAATLVDAGSGAGFPGLPIAVARPEIQVTLIESVGKKAAFLKEASRDLTNVAVIHGRLESLLLQFDWATARAVHSRSLSALGSIARNLAVLTTPEKLAGFGDLGVEWVERLSIPWSRTGLLAIGRFRG